MIENTVEFRNISGLNLLWPKNKTEEKKEKAWKYFQEDEHKYFPKIISETLCKSFNTVVQAGGHCGLYPIQYSRYFESVYTFEPTEVNFYCLKENTKPYKNIHIHNFGLGEIEKKVSFYISNHNSGAHRVNTEASTGSIDLKPIDSLNLTHCDLIHLDLEGYELLALHGAANTIEKFKPIIVLETTNTMEKYGYDKNEVLKFLSKFNYKIIKQWENDTAYSVK